MTTTNVSDINSLLIEMQFNLMCNLMGERFSSRSNSSVTNSVIAKLLSSSQTSFAFLFSIKTTSLKAITRMAVLTTYHAYFIEQEFSTKG